MPYLDHNLHGYKGADGTGFEAAAAAKRTSETRRKAVLGILARHPDGLTTHEIAAALRLPVPTIQPRVSELRNLGLVEPTGDRRRNASGASAAVLRRI